MAKYITFVCLGNICRSPMAEYLFKHKVNQHNLNDEFVITSAGTSGWNDGDDMHHKTKEMLISRNIDYDNFISKKLTKSLFDKSNYIFVMDNSNYNDVISSFGSNSKVRKITNYNTVKNYDEVPDPWYTGDFNETYEIISDALDNILNLLSKDEL